MLVSAGVASAKFAVLCFCSATATAMIEILTAGCVRNLQLDAQQRSSCLVPSSHLRHTHRRTASTCSQACRSLLVLLLVCQSNSGRDAWGRGSRLSGRLRRGIRAASSFPSVGQTSCMEAAPAIALPEPEPGPGYYAKHDDDDDRGGASAPASAADESAGETTDSDEVEFDCSSTDSDASSSDDDDDDGGDGAPAAETVPRRRQAMLRRTANTTRLDLAGMIFYLVGGPV